MPLTVHATSAYSNEAANLADMFFAQAQQHPHKVALYFEETRIDYQTLAAQVRACAQSLAQRGVQRGDHVGIVLPNRPEFVVWMLVAAELGLALVPVNPSLPAAAIVKAFQATDVRHIVSDSVHFEDWDDEQVQWGSVDGIQLCVDAPHAGLEARSGAEKRITMDQCLQALPAAVTYARGQPGDAFILTMTSGSTGDPKPIVLTQSTKRYRAQAAQALYAITAQDVTLAATPLYHSLAERLVLIPLLTGGSSVLMARYSPSEWVAHVQRFQVSFTIAVSSQLKQMATLLQQGLLPGLPSLRCIVSSSALLEHEIKTLLTAHLQCDFHECYGASEIAIASNLNGKDARKLNSVGVAAPTVDIVILDAEQRVLPAGEAGEIACKTSMLFGGYYQRPELTAAAMWGAYFRTGDLGKLDADGYLYYLGRKKDLIISGGINVYPVDIETVLSEVPGILESAAFAFPDETLGEVVAVALVVHDHSQFDLKRAKYLCATRLADYQQPRKWYLVEEIPKNSLGKVMKFQLVQQFAREQVMQARQEAL